MKNNLDAYRGTYPTRKPLLFTFILQNIAEVTATGPLAVEVKMKSPWVAFDTYLTTIGIMGQTQLDDTETCDRELVGTGSFTFESWEVDRELVASRNEDYWQIAPDGEPYPYADEIKFQPVSDEQQRGNALGSGDLNAMLTARPAEIAGRLTDLSESGDINLYVSEDHAEVNFVMLNNSEPPFDDIRMRRAVAMGLDRELLERDSERGPADDRRPAVPARRPGLRGGSGLPGVRSRGRQAVGRGVPGRGERPVVRPQHPV